MKHRTFFSLSVLLVVGVIFSTGYFAAAGNPTLRVSLAKNTEGELTALFQVLQVNSDLKKGGGRLRVSRDLSFRAKIVLDGRKLQSVYTRERWQIKDSPQLAQKIFCDNSGEKLYLTVSDSNNRSKHLSFSIEDIVVKGADTNRRLLRKFCTNRQQDQTNSTPNYRTIPGAKRITDIDNFLNTCPSHRELLVLRDAFTIAYQPKYRTPEPAYSCTKEVGTRNLKPNPTLTYYQALRVIRHMELTKPLPWTNLHPYNWLKSKIGGIIISYEAPKPTCCYTLSSPGSDNPVTAIKIPKADRPLVQSRMSWYDSQSGVGLWNLIGVIFHEARHVDLPHNCGPNGNKDSTLNYMGAWAIQYYIAKRMENGTIDVGLKDKWEYQSALENSYKELLSKRFCEEY